MFAALSLWSLPIPPPPPWEGAHVLLIHFPIALLLVAPLFVFLAMVLPLRARWASLVALILLTLGTAGLFAATMSGEAARDVVDGSDRMFDVLDQHEALAVLTRNIYAGVTGAYAVLVLLPYVFSKLKRAAYLTPVQLVLLVVLIGGALLVGGTAHLGGRLVHEFGVRAAIAEPPEGGGIGNSAAEGP